MKRLILLTIVIFFAFVFPPSFATAPVSISLSYNIDKGILHVEAIHPSFDLEKSYVRLMLVYVNGTQVNSLNYFRQSDYNKFTDDVPVTAQIGDVIRVDLFCELGGELAQEMTVTKEASDNSNQAENSSNDLASANSTFNSVTNENSGQ